MDPSGGSDIGLSEEELFAIKPFEPYKDNKDDDLLTLKMEMLRNRSKVNSNKKNENTTIAPNINQSDVHTTLESKGKETQASPSPPSKSLDIGSENTAFSTRRPNNNNNNKSTNSPKLDHKSPQRETKGIILLSWYFYDNFLFLKIYSFNLIWFYYY